MEFSEQIREIRKENYLTQEEMAARLHVTRQAISNWENGKNLPDIEMLMEISRTFQVSLDRLIFGGVRVGQ
jgi:transcriptional regulator with XRE-family HTH domain